MKKKFIEEKKYSTGTGGGPPIHQPNSEQNESMKAIMGVSLTGLEPQHGAVLDEDFAYTTTCKLD